MDRRIRRLRFALWRAGGVDIVVTHAPVLGFGDGEDLPHQGFAAFQHLIEKYQPKYLLHGHMHANYGAEFTRERWYENTKIINVWEKYVLEIPDEEIKKK